MNHLSTRSEDAVAAKGTTPEQMSCIGRVTHAYITKALDLVVSIQKDYRYLYSRKSLVRYARWSSYKPLALVSSVFQFRMFL
jgi:hypothetical protein